MALSVCVLSNRLLTIFDKRALCFPQPGIEPHLRFVLSLFMVESSLEDDVMDDAKQRELIRLWNLMRKAQGPVAEEIRIQILAQFERVEKKAA
jgi:hypothetical protein